MRDSITLFKQLLSLLPDDEFRKSLRLHETDKYIKSLSSYKLLTLLLYAQITGKVSIRDIVTGLSVQEEKMRCLGMAVPSRSNISYALAHRGYEAFEELFYAVLDKRSSRSRSGKFRFKNPLYAMDSTLINLCLSIFDWAVYRKKKGAIKIHQVIDVKSDIPVCLVMSEGKRHDITAARKIDKMLSSDSILVMDRGYVDFKWLKSLDDRGVFFVTRAKDNMDYKVIGQHANNDRSDVISDEIIELQGTGTWEKYPKRLRLVTVRDKETGKILRFLTNNLRLAASTIGKIYKSRWRIETFFKWIKQHLKIQSFLGTSPNAVMMQIWAAMIYYLLLAWIQFQLRITWSLLELARRIKEALFKNISMLDLLSEKFTIPPKPRRYAEQLTFL